MVYGNFHEKLRRHSLTHFVSHFLINWGKNENEDKKKWKYKFDIWILHIKIRLHDNFAENLKKKYWLIFWYILTNWSKNGDVNKKFWENEFDPWILHIKIRLYGNFLGNPRKNFLTHFLSHFWLIKAKMKMKMKKYGNMGSIFELSI